MRMFSRSAVAFAIASAGLAFFCAPAGALDIKGPIAVTKESGLPFHGVSTKPITGDGLDMENLGPAGYVEEEYFISGTVDGKPYTTAMLVRKPKDPAKFSGLIAVETVHAQGAIPFWTAKKAWMGGGHGWIAVPSQRTALEQLVKPSAPQRYATLQIPDVAPPPPANPPGQASGPPRQNGPQDKFSQDIMTQVGAFLKSNAANSPFHGMNVKYLVMGGASQTGGTTLRYMEDSAAKALMPNGKPIYDGFMPMLAWGDIPALGVPVMHVVSEAEVKTRAARSIALHPDSDTASDRSRHYEMAGSSHIDWRGNTEPPATMVGSLKPGEILNQFPQTAIVLELTQHLIDWVMKGTVPPHAQPIEVANGQVVRDEHGNAKGGIRSPYVDVPHARYIVSQEPAPGENAFFRSLMGTEERFSAEEMKKLYKTRDNYLKLFDAGIDKMLKDGFLYPSEAKPLKTEEAATVVKF